MTNKTNPADSTAEENAMNIRPLAHALRAALVLAVMPALAQASQGNLMSITTTIKMNMIDADGHVSSAMPTQTRTVKECQAPHHMTDPNTWKDSPDCTVSDVHQSAGGMIAHMMCKDGMASDITVKLLPGGGAHATIHTHGATGAQTSVDGQIVTDAKRIGSCDYHGPSS